jgi:hypothetical protein
MRFMATSVVLPTARTSVPSSRPALLHRKCDRGRGASGITRMCESREREQALGPQEKRIVDEAGIAARVLDGSLAGPRPVSTAPAPHIERSVAEGATANAAQLRVAVRSRAAAKRRYLARSVGGCP